MPVTGFPATLERTLSALMVDNTISSWKVAGEGDNTTIVLRLKPVCGPATSTASMADPVLNRETQVQYYRRKPPSQIRRDKERARKQQQQQATDFTVQNYAVNTDCLAARENAGTQYAETTTQAEELGTQPASDSEGEEDGMHGLNNTECTWASDSVCVEPLQSTHTVHCDTVEDDRLVGGFPTGVVKQYAATLIDKSVQRRLKNKGRNKTFRRVALHHAGNGDQLICETDDLVLEYPCTNPVPKYSYWYVKQEPRNMLSEERDKLANLQRGEVVHRSRHADITARAARDLDTLLGLLRFYLG